MDIEEDTDCLSDYLEVYDSYDDVHGLVGRFCGDMLPDDIISTGNVMTLKFLSDGSITGGGFQIKYTALEPYSLPEMNSNFTSEANSDFIHYDIK
ncbi:unnamed protein product [Ranitomeya imitator]|uniref:CUB domain-containing protein n=2 Tax=Ranitomeya imitator TaxID=111125 RepID=A0ABN9LNS1_9NEOB|nr:unnamed protein product [Ranitomeya imitator]